MTPPASARVACAALWCRSNYSFLDGASHPDELVEQAARLGLHGLALTDRDGVYGAVRAWLAARERGLPLALGTTLTLDEAHPIVLLAADREGWASLCGLLTIGRRRSPKGSSTVSLDEVCAHQRGLIALWGTLDWDRRDDPTLAPLAPLRDAFGDRLYAMVTRHRRPDEPAHERRVRTEAGTHHVPIVAGNEVLYHERARRDLHDVVTCIRHRTSLHDVGDRTRPNADHALLSPYDLSQRFRDDPAALARTAEVLDRCRFSLDQIRYRYPVDDLPDGRTAAAHLRQLTLEGARTRYPHGVPPAVVAQIDRELELIDELDYEGYFLTMHELVTFCRREGILCQGRGSAANSAVCFCLGITAVDPVRLDLLFERFLSRERAEPPDIDLDIEHGRREEVIQYVYRRWGREHAAMVANIIRYRTRSAVRDVGRALGVSGPAIDRMSKLLSHQASVSDQVLADAGLEADAPAHRHLVRLATELLDAPRHLSIHPGGFVLGHDPVHTLVPIENATMEDRTVIQWDKYDIEELGLFKVDLLGLGALTQIHRCFDLLRQHRELNLTLASIPADDEPTWEMLGRADTVGVFQIESRAQMSMLPRLRPRCFYDLVIEVSIVRPGPITGDMVHPYLRRRHGEEPVAYPHPSLEPVLRKTLGVPLFQEQVMKLAVVAADYTPGEADQLRRDMAAWRSSGRIEQHHERLVARMVDRGIEPEFAERVFAQIRGFGEYGFPESHAASFALISWATSWLRCHFPAAFVCSLLDAQPMGFYTPATLVDDARRHGVEVRPVDVTVSRWFADLEPAAPGHFDPHAVRLGIRSIRGFPRHAWEHIEAARTERPFDSVDDLVQRAGLGERPTRLLAEAGALDPLAGDRRTALWQGMGARTRPDAPLAPVAEAAPELDPLDAFEEITWDYRAQQLSTRGHPLEAIRDALSARGLPDAAGVTALRDGARTHYVGMVICRQRPGTAGGVVFMTLEDESGFVNLIVWKDVFEQHAVVARTTSVLGVTGRVQSDHGVVHLVAESLWIPQLSTRPEVNRSRDFH